MDKVARLPADDRAALFGETGAGRGVADTIIEKDFWVCWTLKRLFGLPDDPKACHHYRNSVRQFEVCDGFDNGLPRQIGCS